METKPQYKPAEPVIEDDKVECYWCERTLPVSKMTQESKYGVKVYVCNQCGQ